MMILTVLDLLRTFGTTAVFIYAMFYVLTVFIETFFTSVTVSSPNEVWNEVSYSQNRFCVHFQPQSRVR